LSEIGTHHQAMLLVAQEQLSRGNNARAVKLLRDVLSAAPNHAAAHALLALALVSQKRLHAAAYEATIAVGQDPELPAAHLALGVVRMGQRRFRESEEHLRQAIALNPDGAVEHRMLAALFGQSGRRREALAELQAALSADPASADIQADLAEHYLEEGTLFSAMRYAQEALRMAPSHVGALVAMGGIRLREGKVEEAREHAHWALRQAPNDPRVLTLLAAIKARSSFTLGLWWRYHAWMSRFADGQQVIVLLGAYVLYRVTDTSLTVMDAKQLSSLLELAWLGTCVYSWVGPTLFQRSIEKELQPVRLRPDF
jgi:tetratricopeptide (TPR) repeat protein